MTDEQKPMIEQIADDDTCQGFFTDMENDKPFLKLGVEGFAGTGKTYLLVQLAIGLHRRLQSAKPIVFFDTEKAGKFARQMFDEAGIRVLHKQSRSLADLKTTMKLIQDRELSDILLCDSLTHIWENFLEAYKAKTKRQRLEIQDWGIIKPSWKSEFSDHLVQDPYHFLFAGRAGYEYDQEVDDRGKKQFVKSGVKMKVEGETAYEPDVLVLMERFERVLEEDKKQVWREATVIKDRSGLIDGKTFKNPTYEDFSPAVERCLSGGVKRAAPLEGDAAVLFRTEEDVAAFKKRVTIALEQIEGELTSTWPGQAAEPRKMRIDALAKVFGTRSWTAITQKPIAELEAGLAGIKAECAAYLKDQAEKAAGAST